jgi:predicted acetyltransferase
MFRLVDLAAAWRVRRVEPAARLTLHLEVTDPQLPANQGAWTLRFEAGTAEVERGTRGSADGTLRCGIAELSRLYAGSASVARLVEAAAAELDRQDRIDQIDRALRLRRPWTFDRF